MDLDRLSISEIANNIKSGDLSATEIVQFYLDRIASKDSSISSFLYVDYEGALKRAQEIDNQTQKEGKLLGVPVGIKDNMNVIGLEATAGSRILKGYKALYDATVISKIKSEGGIIIGKTNLDEFAMGSSTENSAFMSTKNPLDVSYVPGGSSGGSAAAVAAGFVPVALGSDTGGSVRQPAAFCGVVGLKPTYGRVSRYGLIAFGSSLDVIGPLTRTVKDSALMLSVIAGFDKNDETTVNTGIGDYTSHISEGVKGMKIGLIKEIMDFKIDSSVVESLKEACRKLETLGAQIVEISIPHLKYALPTYYIVAPSEASANLARFDGVRYGFEGEGDSIKDFYENTRTRGFGTEVKRRILIGTFALSSGFYDAYYLKAAKVRRVINNDFERAFENVSTIILPTTPTTPFKFGEKKSPLDMYMSDIFTIPVNLAGVPAISVPFGKDDKGFSIGIQLIGKWFDEETLLRVGFALENL
ncbi:MAG: Asp-tRNA(Asn)/Glu-tRNA(Gln) amidotransferase subunit GatA [Caldisericaceae bacterium]